jgi:YesN/AraC family two-component response regulator
VNVTISYGIRIISKYPQQKAIIASGYSETERVREAQRLGAGRYVKKPA